MIEFCDACKITITIVLSCICSVPKSRVEAKGVIDLVDIIVDWIY